MSTCSPVELRLASAQYAEPQMKIEVDVVLRNGEEEPEEGAAPASAQRDEATTAAVMQQTGRTSGRTHVYICIYAYMTYT